MLAQIRFGSIDMRLNSARARRLKLSALGSVNLLYCCELRPLDWAGLGQIGGEGGMQEPGEEGGSRGLSQGYGDDREDRGRAAGVWLAGCLLLVFRCGWIRHLVIQDGEDTRHRREVPKVLEARTGN